MCGIAGILNGPEHEPVSFDTLRRMIAMLSHRGPDEHGFFRDAHVGLGHARLSIIDLAGGAQPLANEDETIWVTFNGEIFNYLELRADLEQCGHRFATRSDTEVIVHSYEQYGEQAWRRFNGQFALALWDQPACAIAWASCHCSMGSPLDAWCLHPRPRPSSPVASSSRSSTPTH